MPGAGATENGPLTTDAVLRMSLVGANTGAEVTGAEELPGRSNYFIGNDPKQWRTNVPNYAKVRYKNVYPGVDLVYYGNQSGQLEYDFVVAPGADPAAIQLALSGGLEAESGSQSQAAAQSKIQNLKSKIDTSGDLVAKIDGGEVRFHKPAVYQPAISGGRLTADSAQRTPVEGEYVLEAGNKVEFKVAAYDHTRPLFIDPVLLYSTYLGGNGYDYAKGLAVDSSGNAYLTGATSSTNFPTLNAIQGTNNAASSGLYNAFVTKLNPTGTALVYSTYLGGSTIVGGEQYPQGDVGEAIDVDSLGNAYVTGSTQTTNFPISPPPPPSTTCPSASANNVQICYGGGNYDAFVTELNSAGNALVYSTYLGGAGGDVGYGIAPDSLGNAYITGYTEERVSPSL